MAPDVNLNRPFDARLFLMDQELTFSGTLFDPVMVPTFRASQIVLSLFFILLIGVTASLYPAHQATKIDVAEAMKFDGIAAAVSSSDLRAGNLPDTPLMARIRRNFFVRHFGYKWRLKKIFPVKRYALHLLHILSL